MAKSQWEPWREFVQSELRRMNDNHDKMNEVLIRNTALLEEHMRRTEAAEEGIKVLKEDLAPVKTHVAALKLIAKWVGLLGTVVSIAVGVAKFVGFI